jgi:hypothetical protein|tara:strand:+ start:1276 stop:1560 length:285 start_codon:yes stop_codon:yes gene_type:complete
MDPAKLYELLQTLTSTGFKTDSFEFKLPLTTKYQISKERSDIVITFSGDLPTVTVKKFLTLTISVEGIELDRLGGTLLLDNFPDIPFEYEWFIK